jgi:hypothetical protein
MAAGGAHPPLIVLYRQPNGRLWCVDRAAGCCDALLSRTHRAGGSIAWLWRSVARSRTPLAARTYRTRRRCRHTSELHAGTEIKAALVQKRQRRRQTAGRLQYVVTLFLRLLQSTGRQTRSTTPLPRSAMTSNACANEGALASATERCRRAAAHATASLRAARAPPARR